MEKLALEFALSNSDIDTTLVGTASLEEVSKNIKWAESLFQKGFSNEKLLREVEEILKPIKNRSWKSGLQENNDH